MKEQSFLLLVSMLLSLIVSAIEIQLGRVLICPVFPEAATPLEVITLSGGINEKTYDAFILGEIPAERLRVAEFDRSDPRRFTAQLPIVPKAEEFIAKSKDLDSIPVNRRWFTAGM